MFDLLKNTLLFVYTERWLPMLVGRGPGISWSWSYRHIGCPAWNAGLLGEQRGLFLTDEPFPSPKLMRCILLRASVAVVKPHNQKSLGEGRVYFSVCS